MALRLGLIGVGNGSDLEAALAAPGVEVTGFYGEQPELVAGLVDYHGVAAAPDWRALLTADALVVGPPLSAPGEVLSAIAAAGKPLLLCPALLAAPDAPQWTAELAQSSAPAGLASWSAVDAGAGYARDLVRAGVLGELLGVEVRTAASAAWAWSALAFDLTTTLWVSGLKPTAVAALQAKAGEAAYVSAVVATQSGVPLTISLRGGVPGGLQETAAPCIMGTQGQLLLTPEPQGWFTSASESNRSQTWEKLVYAGPRGSQTGAIVAFAEALAGGGALPLTLAECLPLVRVLAALRAATRQCLCGTV